MAKTTFYQKKFLNSVAAEITVKDWARASWLAWYNPKNPKESSLERNFPLNLALRSLLSLGVLVYLAYSKKKLKKLLLY